jgi:hypothetical protein
MKYTVVASKGKRLRSLRVKAPDIRKAHKRASKRTGKHWHVVSVIPSDTILKGTRARKHV